MKFLATLLVSVSFFTPAFAFAEEFQISGWIPYWRGSQGVKEARTNLEVLTEVMPFAYALKKDGSLLDQAKMNNRTWQRFFREARREDISLIPTVMAFDGALIHSVLSDEKKRANHIAYIVEEVKKGNFDGIDIDYEGKRGSTRDYFSLFLKELNIALGDKTLSCTIEARTPPEDLYRVVPKDIVYANDLREINEHCDVVRVMAYDQQRADLTLNDARKGAPYIPVADSEWVEKVIDFMARDIDKDKMVLGVATYGAEWNLTVSPEWFRGYEKRWSLNPVYATDLADDLDITPIRNAAGELSFTYLPKKSPARSYKAPRGTEEGNQAAMQALAYANATGKSTLVHVVWWSDPEAIAEKVELAKEKRLRGVALFKIDGGTPKETWANIEAHLASR